MIQSTVPVSRTVYTQTRITADAVSPHRPQALVSLSHPPAGGPGGVPGPTLRNAGRTLGVGNGRNRNGPRIANGEWPARGITAQCDAIRVPTGSGLYSSLQSASPVRDSGGSDADWCAIALPASLGRCVQALQFGGLGRSV
jgi:hypothetical protein